MAEGPDGWLDVWFVVGVDDGVAVWLAARPVAWRNPSGALNVGSADPGCVLPPIAMSFAI